MVFPVELMLSATGDRLQRRTTNPAKTLRCHEVMLSTAPIISKVTDKEDLIAQGQLELRKGEVKWQERYNDYQVLRGSREDISLKHIILP